MTVSDLCLRLGILHPAMEWRETVGRRGTEEVRRVESLMMACVEDGRA